MFENWTRAFDTRILFDNADARIDDNADARIDFEKWDESVLDRIRPVLATLELNDDCRRWTESGARRWIATTFFRRWRLVSAEEVFGTLATLVRLDQSEWHSDRLDENGGSLR